jgi:hypothetical protein
VSVRLFPERTKEGKTCPECSWYHQIGWHLDKTKEGEGGSLFLSLNQESLSLSLSISLSLSLFFSLSLSFLAVTR